MDSKLKKQFESSDNSLVFVHILLLITSVVLAIGSMIAGIIMWGNADLGSTHYNHTLTGLGFAFFFGGPVLFFVGYKLAMAAVWLMFDIKVESILS